MALFFTVINVFFLGLAGGANPGPVLIFSCTESVKSGFKKSFKIILWALIAESIVAFAILLIVSSLKLTNYIFYSIGIIGGIYLVYIAWQISKINELKNNKDNVFSFKKILIITLLNGPFWLFWISICVPLAIEMNNSLPEGYWLFLFVFEFGWLVATTLIVFIFSRFRSVMTNKKVISITYNILALILLYIALSSIIKNTINLINV